MQDGLNVDIIEGTPIDAKLFRLIWMVIL